MTFETPLFDDPVVTRRTISPFESDAVMTFVLRWRRLWRRRGALQALAVRLLLIGLATSCVVSVWEAFETGKSRPVPQREPAPPASAEIKPDRKIEERTNMAVVGEALDRRGGDLSSLSDFEMRPPYLSIDGTTLSRGGTILRFDGIEGPRATDVCLDGQGLRWSCGLQARAALHNFLAGRALSCTPVRALGDGGMTARCLAKSSEPRESEQDVATALVALGWARPAGNASGPLAEAEGSARASAAGLWRGNWTFSPPR